MLEMYNQVYGKDTDMDLRFIAVLLIGVMSSGNENVTKKDAYDLVMWMYKNRNKRDAFRMSYFPRYFQNGIKIAVATIKKVKQNQQNAI